MTHAKPGHLILTCATLLLLVFLAACETGARHAENDHAVWFIQLTDPHIFLDGSTDTDTKTRQEELDKKAIADFWKQIPALDGDRPISFLVLTGDLGVEPCSIRDVAAGATTATAKPAPASPTAGTPAPSTPATATPGAAPPAGGKSAQWPKSTDCIDNGKQPNQTKRGEQIIALSGLFASSPVRDIYLTAGNNDIASEVASDDGLEYFNQFIDDVQKKIDESKKNVQLHNLTGCYVAKGSASSCYADVADTPYRLIGFPSYSFKNYARSPGASTNTAFQEKQFEIFRGLLDQARQAGKKVLVLSHIPLIDDPYIRAQDVYAAAPLPTPISDPANTATKDSENPRSKWSTWNVSKKLSDEWQDAIASDTVVGVLAGHLHDSHKEIYRQPYSWSSVNDQKTGFKKLYLAPPLSVKNQDSSPIQARGFSLVGLRPDEIKYEIYWYNAEKGDFAPDQKEQRAGREEHHRGSIGRAIVGGVEKIVLCVWQFLCPKDLDQSAVLLIALLAAFLTVVQIWQIPPPDLTLKSSSGQGSAPAGQSGGAQTPDTKAGPNTSPFLSNFGQTIIAGLGGLAAETVLKSLENKPAGDDKNFYIVWFVTLFLLLLFSLALFRAFVEAIRSRVAIIHYPLARRSRVVYADAASSGSPPNAPVSKDPPKRSAWSEVWDNLKYWFLRILQWFFSLKVQILTFLDTFINLIQGKNQTNTRVFGDIIIDQQRNIVRVAHTIRRHLQEVMLQQLFKKQHDPFMSSPPTSPPTSFEHRVTPQSFRINISVLSADQTKVFYVARSPGSSVLPFPKRSIAWISVVTGRIRWYRKTYADEGLINKIVLFDNSSGVLPDQEKTIYLQSNYQSRDDDYDAFVVFPVPYPLRGYGTNYVKGAIQISFRHQEHFDAIFPINPDPLLQADPLLPDGARGFKSEGKMLDDWCPDPEVRESLREGVAVLGELLRGFNETIFLNYPEGNNADD